METDAAADAAVTNEDYDMLEDDEDTTENGTEKQQNGDPDPEQSNIMFVKNLLFSCTEDDVRAHFPGCTSVRIPTGNDGFVRGFAFVEFESADEVKSTIKEKQGSELAGRELYLDVVSNTKTSKTGSTSKRRKKVPGETPPKPWIPGPDVVGYYAIPETLTTKGNTISTGGCSVCKINFQMNCAQDHFSGKKHAENLMLHQPNDFFRARLCHLSLSSTFQGYGFNLQQKMNVGEFIIDIAPNSPADDGKLKVGDRVVEINGYNINNANHAQVNQLIRSEPGNVCLLVVDAAADQYFSINNIRIHSRMPNVQVLDQQDASQLRARLIHVHRRPDFQGYGFNVQDQPYLGEFIIDIKPNSPAEDAGLLDGDRIVEVNGINISNFVHELVIKHMKSSPNTVSLLVVNKAADAHFAARNIHIHSNMPDVLVIDKHVSRPPVRDPLYCKTCDIRVETLKEMAIHMKENDHARLREMKKMQLRKDMEEKGLIVVSGVPTEPMDEAVDINKWIELVKKPLVGLEHIHEVHPRDEKDKVSYYVCEICGVSNMFVFQHLISSGHIVQYAVEHYDKVKEVMDSVEATEEEKEAMMKVIDAKKEQSSIVNDNTDVMNLAIALVLAYGSGTVKAARETEESERDAVRQPAVSRQIPGHNEDDYDQEHKDLLEMNGRNFASFTSRNLRVIAKEQKRRRKRLTALEGIADGLHCETCDFDAASKEEMAQHLKDKDHPRLERYVKKMKLKEEIKEKGLIAITKVPTELMPNAPANIEDWFDVIENPLIGLEHIYEVYPPIGLAYYVCDLCCVSNMFVLQHITSPGHILQYMIDHFAELEEVLLLENLDVTKEEKAALEEIIETKNSPFHFKQNRISQDVPNMVASLADAIAIHCGRKKVQAVKEVTASTIKIIRQPDITKQIKGHDTMGYTKKHHDMLAKTGANFAGAIIREPGVTGRGGMVQVRGGRWVPDRGSPRGLGRGARAEFGRGAYPTMGDFEPPIAPLMHKAAWGPPRPVHDPYDGFDFGPPYVPGPVRRPLLGPGPRPLMVPYGIRRPRGGRMPMGGRGNRFAPM